ncbi:MAG: glycosyltransferase family 39 protein [Bacteroidales bacterium]|nr:glycosyltransferase family 39 protein [Bacteroidales bacterium]
MLLFFTIVYAHVFSSQLGTADDAAIALAARNLSEGNGYTTSVAFNGTFGLDKFSTGITTGPVLVLPAALLMLIFGSTFWVPGFVVATVSLLFVLFIIRRVQKQTNLMQALVFISLLLFFFYNLTAGYHFTSWFVLLGELPATFLGILAVLVLASAPQKRSTIISACLLFGLAFMTKMLSFLGFLPVIAWFVFSLIKERKKRKELFINYSLGALAFVTPYLLFEIWKLLSLGTTAYFENWHAFIKLFARLSGAGDALSLSLPERFVQRNKELSDHFKFSVSLLLLVAVPTSFVILKYAKQKWVRLLFIFLMLGAFFHLFYWVFFSTGLFRYTLIGLFLYFSALSCILFIKIPRPLIAAISLLFVLLFLSTSKNLQKPVSTALTYGFNYNTRLLNLQKTVAFLKDYQKDKPFVSSWWASVVDVEYAMPTLQNFKRFDKLGTSDYNHDLILVSNTVFTNHYHFPGFDEWSENCFEVLLDAPPYLVSRCGSLKLRAEPEHTIDFSSQGNSEDYTTYGWGKQEEDFRWSSDLNAGIRFPVPAEPADGLAIQLLCFPYLARGKIPQQPLIVRVNNHIVAEWSIINQRWFKVLLPLKLLGDESIVHLDFELKNAASPASFGHSNDTRLLGFGVKKIKISVYNND